MRLFIGIIMLMCFASCSSDNANVIEENVSITGNWKPYKYEFRGKNIMLDDCQKKGQILINGDFSGVYERYGLSTTGDCHKLDSFVGKWSYDKLYNILTLTYAESGENKTMKKEVDSYSTTELRIHDNSQNLDNVPGNDEAILVFRKE